MTTEKEPPRRTDFGGLGQCKVRKLNVFGVVLAKEGNKELARGDDIVGVI